MLDAWKERLLKDNQKPFCLKQKNKVKSRVSPFLMVPSPIADLCSTLSLDPWARNRKMCEAL